MFFVLKNWDFQFQLQHIKSFEVVTPYLTIRKDLNKLEEKKRIFLRLQGRLASKNLER